MIKLDILNDLKDDELKGVIEHSQALLKQRDDDRKAKALEQVRTLLASVGLSLKDVAGKAHKGNGRNVYRAGTVYQHPTNKALTYNGKGKKPGWLTALEADGKTAIEVRADI
jgi:DNA-binding protein H-NS